MRRPRHVVLGALVVAMVATGACGGAEEEVTALDDPEEAVEDEPAPAEVEEVAETADTDDPGETEDADGEPAEEDDTAPDPRERGTELEVVLANQATEDGLPCPMVELEDGERLHLALGGIAVDDNGAAAEDGVVLDFDHDALEVLLREVRAGDTLGPDPLTGDVVAREGDTITIVARGVDPLEALGMMRQACGAPDEELLWADLP